MKKQKLLILGLLGGICLTHAQTETSGRDKIYRQTHTKHTELDHTKLNVRFDYENEQMEGEEWLTASPYFYPSDSLVLDAKAMLIHEVALVKKGKKEPLSFEYNAKQLRITLDKTYQKGEKYTVYIRYIARPNKVDQKGSAAISDAKGLYFINSKGEDTEKPTQIWTQGETESSSAWFPTIDKPNQKTTQEISMTVPEQYITLSNGILTSQKKAGNGLRTDHWVMKQRHAPYLFFMGVGEYAVIKDKWKDIEVDYYVEKEYEPYAQQIFGDTPEMMSFFSSKLGYEYPWSKYAQITGRDYVSGAMENTTAVLHGESAQQKPGDLIDENRWENVIAHELFHHWFGDLVTAESWSNLTVNESFANYSEYLWLEHKYGKDLADVHLAEYKLGYIFDPMNISKDLVRFNYHAREDMFDGVSYNKGGLILHMLRSYLGDDAFFAGIKEYLHAHAYQATEAHNLRLCFEKVSGKDLNWFFNQWYFGSGHPELTYTSAYNATKKETTIVLKQTQALPFQFPLTVDLFVEGKRQRHKVWVNAKDTFEFKIKTAKPADFINLNADGIVLCTIKEDKKTAAHYQAEYLQTPEFYTRQKALEASLKQADKNEIAAQTLTKGLDDTNYHLVILSIDGIDLNTQNHADLALTKIENLAKKHPKTLVRAAALSSLAKTKNKTYLPLFEKGINEVSNAIKTACITGLVNLAPEKAKAHLNQVEIKNVANETFKQLLPIIIDNAMEKHLPSIADRVVFYPFVKLQDPATGKQAEKGFNWLMTTDNTKATANAVAILKQVKGNLSNNPQAKKMIIDQVIKKGLQLKMKTRKEHPQSSSLKKQVKMLEDLAAEYSNS